MISTAHVIENKKSERIRQNDVYCTLCQVLGAKYLLFVSSRSVKLRELSFAQFVYFWGKVCLFFNF